MRLLLTNDDGVTAEGIHDLAEVLSRENDVWIIAPDRNRSGVSHCITMNEPLRLRKVAERIYSCSGVPADCVITGLRSSILDGPPDAVISGINRGSNLGTDLLYSGTAAAARQAVLYGVPGIALSVEAHDGIWRYGALARFTADNLQQLVSLTHTAGTGGISDGLCAFVNVNALSREKYDGVEMADEISFREYRDTVKLIDGPDGDTYSFFCGGNTRSHGGAASDYRICKKGFISVSRVCAEPRLCNDVDDIMFSL
ncbi:MAG: 5'/3'-nucleotidase SurE [Treponema sp.]